MSKQAQVGAFTILGIIATFAVFFVLADFGTRAGGYKVGVRFPAASGLRTGAIVSLSGVPIGAVDKISLLPDYSTEVVLAVNQGYEIPSNSRFVIQAPLTGEPSVLIDIPRNQTPGAALPHGVQDLDNQPRGANPATISDLLEQGQGEVKRVDSILETLQKEEPQLLAELHQALNNTNHLTSHADESLTRITGKVERLTDALQSNMQLAGSNVVDLTGRLDQTAKRDSGQIDELLAQFAATSRSFRDTVDQVHGMVKDPRVRENLVNTTRDFALTAHTFALLTGDLRNVTGNQQTQNQLRDTVAQIDATTQRVDSLVGQLGGKSAVYGIDPNATPAPETTPTPPGFLPTSKPAIPANGATPAAVTPGDGSVRTASAGTSSAGVAALRSRLNNFTKDLVQLQIRVGQLSPARQGSIGTNTSPLLTTDRGPQSDFNLYVLPHGSTGLVAGVNDIGSAGTSTANLMLIKRSGSVQYSGGILYSRLGGTASIARGALGLEARAYDLRHPTLDTYLNLLAAPKFQLFGGERDVTHQSRRTVFGAQFEL